MSRKKTRDFCKTASVIGYSQPMKYDFDRLIERRNTDSIKWTLYAEDVIPLWVADMDFPSAEPIVRALTDRARHGVFGYSLPPKALTLALIQRLKELYGWSVAEPEVIFLPGIVTGLNIAFQAYVERGEAVLAQPPVYFHFLRDPVQHGRVLIDPPLVRSKDSWEIDFDLFERSITPSTKLFVLCNPHNPVGRVFSRQELERIAEICLRHGLIICSDEIHCDLVFPPYRHIPIATLAPEIADRTVTLMAPSKTYNIAGLGCGYAVIRNRRLRDRWKEASSGIVPHVNIMGHVAALAGLTEGQDWLDQVIEYLKGNRDFLYEYVGGKIPFMTMNRVEATYLAWLDCQKLGIVGNPAVFFRSEARVALSDGLEFGKPGEGFVRLNFACPRHVLSEALDRMKHALEKC